MILLLAIVQSEDVYKLSRQLLDQGFRLTQINSFGGFLSAGSVVLLLGVEDQRVPTVLETIDATCQERSDFANSAPWLGAVGMPPGAMLAPMEVLVGGAVVFGLPVERFLRLPGAFTPHPLHHASSNESVPDIAQTNATVKEGDPSIMPDSEPTTLFDAVSPDAEPASSAKLVVAIVHSDDTNTVVNALLEAGHRLTRVNTAGGFLRRGNATLLIGVKAQDVDGVLSLIHASCRPRTEPNPPEAGMPMYGATVFVLNTSHFLRF